MQVARGAKFCYSKNMAKQDNAGKGEFRGDKKFGQSWLHGPEERLKAFLIPLVPKGVETYHLTSMTVLWALLVPVFSILARRNNLWMLGVCALIVAQYVTDLLDGAIGRLRGTGLVKWGFFMDHFLDFVFLCSMLVGYALTSQSPCHPESAA